MSNGIKITRQIELSLTANDYSLYGSAGRVQVAELLNTQIANILNTTDAFAPAMTKVRELLSQPNCVALGADDGEVEEFVWRIAKRFYA